MASFTWSDLGKLKRMVSRLGNPDAAPLMEQWKGFIVEGNRRGVLAGVDGNDQPMPPLKYRGGKGKRTADRKVPDYGTTKHKALTGPGANLTTAEYQRLTGPRLAPRREESRVIRNLQTETRHTPGSRLWEAVGAWKDVVSAKGVPFLPFHFEPSAGSRLPRYDLRPVRPREYRFALNAFTAWVKQLLRVT